MWVLLTGMSGSGKSTLVRELQRRGFAAWDADDDGYSEPRPDGRWGWRTDAVRDLLGTDTDPQTPRFFAGCSDEQGWLPFDYTVLLTAPEALLVGRVSNRTTNTYGQSDDELELIRHDVRQVEPLLRTTANLVVDTTTSVETVADVVLHAVTSGADP